MAELSSGIYERLVTEALAVELVALDQRSVDERGLDPGEVGDRVGRHVAAVLGRVLADVSDEDRVETAIKVANELLGHALEAVANGDEAAEEPNNSDLLEQTGRVLQAIRRQRPDGKYADIAQPLVPVLDTVLLTNSPDEESLWAQLRSEIASADRIDILMAFVRRSGIRPLQEALAQHCESGKPIRVLTTTFTGTTEAKALELFREIGAEVRVSYDTASTRLHAKAWMFHRDSGASTSYIGSSNLTRTALSPGMEWNVRLSRAQNASVFQQFDAVFSSYWHGGEFVDYDAKQFQQMIEPIKQRESPGLVLSPIEVRPYPFQERLLEQLAVSRHQGFHRNLLVAATGTGKTVMAAIDYQRLAKGKQRPRLLFIAHRKEILDQSRNTFRQVLRDPNFGELWVDGERPTDDGFDHVFASIQSLNANDLDALDPSQFEIVIVDEFHHAAAASYDKILNHLQPTELLGLTATPERSDGAPILGWFDDRIAAELRLWDAIAQQHLSPFVYYGINDGTDLREVPWRRGRGYDPVALTNVYTSDRAWARIVMQRLDEHVDVADMTAFGFCVSVEHANFMAQAFTAAGIPAVPVTGTTPSDQRRQALELLRRGELKVVFTVDLFNEGVDVPDVDTLLMLRPTESPVLFLQQLGRGLRRAEDKPYCTVLDYIGNQRQEFRFDRKYRALLGGSRADLERNIKAGFPHLPSGCSMQLDRVAADTVLDSVKNAIPSTWRGKASELAIIAAHQPDIDLSTFLTESGLDLDDIYTGRTTQNGWSDLCADAGLPVRTSGPSEDKVRHAIGRLLHIDDGLRITTYQRLLGEPQPPQLSTLQPVEQRLAHMLVSSMVGQVAPKSADIQQGIDLLWQHPQPIDELRQLLGVLEPRINHLHPPLETHPDVPLRIHARYTRVEILAALGEYQTTKMPTWQTGVRKAKHIEAELLAFTFDKSSRGFSPTTRYRDYAISPTLIHWESQSVTRADSETGLRYRNHQQQNRSILLFARPSTNDRSFWFLGPATYITHQGERPMAVTWQLDHSLPSDLYQSFAAAVV